MRALPEPADRPSLPYRSTAESCPNPARCADYRMMAGYWPTADQLPDSNANTVAFSRIWKPMPKLLFSRTATQAEWNTTVTPDVDEICTFDGTVTGLRYARAR